MDFIAYLLAPLATPLAIVLVSLLLLRQLRQDVHPIFIGIVGGLAERARSNSLFFAMALAYAAGASLQSLADVAREFHWIYVLAFAKVMQPGVIAVIAYVNKAPLPATEVPGQIPGPQKRTTVPDSTPVTG